MAKMLSTKQLIIVGSVAVVLVIGAAYALITIESSRVLDPKLDLHAEGESGETATAILPRLRFMLPWKGTESYRELECALVVENEGEVEEVKELEPKLLHSITGILNTLAYEDWDDQKTMELKQAECLEAVRKLTHNGKPRIRNLLFQEVLLQEEHSGS